MRITFSGNSSVGRARPCQGRGREFESRFPLQILSTGTRPEDNKKGPNGPFFVIGILLHPIPAPVFGKPRPAQRSPSPALSQYQLRQSLLTCKKPLVRLKVKWQSLPG